MTERATGPFLHGPHEGDALWVLGGLYTFRARGRDTGMAYTAVEVRGPRGFSIPVHVHEAEEEGFYVAAGTVTFRIGQDDHTVEAGAFAFVPRGTEHAFRLDTPDARLLLLLTPGDAGHEGLFEEMGEPAPRREIPPPPSDEPDPEALGVIAERHGTRLVGAPI